MAEGLSENDGAKNVIRFYSDMVYRLAFSETGTRFDADEIYQEVFLRYLKKAPRFKSEEHRKAWLIRVTINCSKSFHSSAWQKKTTELKDDITLEEKSDYDLLYELQQLPPKYREVIHLFYYEDMSLEEMSRVLNRKNSTIRTQLTRARSMLKVIIEEENCNA